MNLTTLAHHQLMDLGQCIVRISAMCTWSNDIMIVAGDACLLATDAGRAAFLPRAEGRAGRHRAERAGRLTAEPAGTAARPPLPPAPRPPRLLLVLVPALHSTHLPAAAGNNGMRCDTAL